MVARSGRHHARPQAVRRTGAEPLAAAALRAVQPQRHPAVPRGEQGDLLLRQPHPDAGRAQGPAVSDAPEGHLRLLHHAEGGAERQLRQLRCVQAVRRRHAGQCAEHCGQADCVDTALRSDRVSEAVEGVLSAAGVFGAGSHCIPDGAGAGDFRVHFGEPVRGPSGVG